MSREPDVMGSVAIASKATNATKHIQRAMRSLVLLRVGALSLMMPGFMIIPLVLYSRPQSTDRA
jgi:hypothetical protein